MAHLRDREGLLSEDHLRAPHLDDRERGALADPEPPSGDDIGTGSDLLADDSIAYPEMPTDLDRDAG